MAISFEDFEYLDESGSFHASGKGFFYNYSAREGTILISDRTGYRIKEVFPPAPSPESALLYVRMFEKSSQIKALRLSSNKTTDIFKLMIKK